MSATDPNDHRLDHLVVLMFENRSFDNLLGYLYRAGEVPSFEGVDGRSLSNPVPDDASGAVVPVHPSTSMATPYPDPGEEYPHVNTQLFGTVDPPSNAIAEIDRMVAPFNAPSDPIGPPPMSGFVADYAHTLTRTFRGPPTPAEVAQIMACYTPDQLPVLSGLARGFACFDHWFCEVPSQTYPNRSFFHAATSSGFVLNGHPPGKFATGNDAPTIFNLLEKAGRTWKVYIDPAQILPATGLIHARVLAPYFADHFRTIYDFYEDARTGALPHYAFLEPNMFHPHTDMHPHSGDRWTERLPPPDTIHGGEALLARVYDAVRGSTSSAGSNWWNTALLVTFDEHGGTFDHVPPPSAEPPDESVREEGFGFDRLGVRVPTVLVSAWVEGGAVVTDLYRSTSALRTLRDWWQLPGPLTRRDATAPSLVPLLTASRPRPPEEWPDVAPRDVGAIAAVASRLVRAAAALDAPMERLERDLLGDALAHEANATGRPVAADAESVSHREAHGHFDRIGEKYFPGVRNGRRA